MKVVLGACLALACAAHKGGGKGGGKGGKGGGPPGGPPFKPDVTEDWSDEEWAAWKEKQDWDYEYFYGVKEKYGEKKDRGVKVALRAPAGEDCLCEGTCAFGDTFWVSADAVELEDEAWEARMRDGPYDKEEKRRALHEATPLLKRAGRLELVAGTTFGAAGLTGDCRGKATFVVAEEADHDEAWVDCETGDDLFPITVEGDLSALGDCLAGDYLHVWKVGGQGDETYWEEEVDEEGDWELDAMEAELVAALDAMTLTEAHMAILDLDQAAYDAMSTDEKVSVWRELEAVDEELRANRKKGYTPQLRTPSCSGSWT